MENSKIIGESRANKYIIPFSRKEVRVGDYILFWYDESDNKGTKGEATRIEELADTI